jgi:hypothetical protein
MVSRLGAGTIVDVTGESEVRLRTGDALTFEIQAGSFARNAGALGLSQDPTAVSFAFLSSPGTGAGDFSAWLGPAAFDGPLTFRDGSLSSVGAVSTMQGFLTLSPELSQEIFGGGTAVLRLRNDGPAVTLGLAPETLRQDLWVSLGGGGLSVGGLVGSVELEMSNPVSFRAAPLIFSNAGAAGFGGFSTVPEPDSSALFFAGGLLLCGISALLTRLRR